jgi:two-component system sensor histidine kinase AlgZ
MHPIFRSGKLGLYLLAWLPVGAVLAVLLAKQGGLSWPVSAAIALPLCVVYAFICLSAWYSCRGLPLHREQLPRLLITHLGSALGIGGLWTALAKILFVSYSAAGSIDAVLPSVFGMGVVLYLLAVAVHYVLLAVEASRMAEAREAEARLLAGEAELRALKAQINPHFLFNSLHSISALTSSDAAKAREMCVLLSGFLRSTLGLGDRAAIPLEEELALARSYLAIEKVRFGARLQVEENIRQACSGFLVPSLLLQPLVENAVIHGIANLIETGFIRISADVVEGDNIAITVENSFDADAPPTGRGGFGLAATRKRLDTLYGGRATLHAGTHDGTYRVELQLPAEEDR